MNAAQHEAGLAAFLIPAQARRVQALLESGAKKRKKLLSLFYHKLAFAPSAQLNLDATCRSVDDLVALLQRRGAPDQCHAMSNDSSLDGRTLGLADAVSRTFGMSMGTFISCIPGQLAYFEGEDPGERYLLIGGERP